jgi:hypothetical protein
MAGDPVTAVATLLSQAFGFAVDAEGYGKMSRESKLTWIMRGINDSIAKNDVVTHDALLNEYRELYAQIGP